ncbi:unnamed protein product, partial [marine sediment metagenome]
MARRTSEINILIRARDQASKAAKSSQASFQKFGKYLAVGFAAATAAAGLAITGLVRVMKSSVAAADEQEKALKNLEAAMKATGDFTEAASKDFEDFASALQKVTTTGDETTLGLLAISKAFGATNEQAKEMVATA